MGARIRAPLHSVKGKGFHTSRSFARKGMAKREFYVVVEKDGNGGFKGDVAQFFSCKSRGKTLDDLMANMRKAIRDAAQKGCEAMDSELHGMYHLQVIVESTQEKREFCVVVQDDSEDGYIGIAQN